MNTSVLASLNNSLLNLLKNDERVFILGEDILDPYGGAFKVTRGCSSAYPERVISTPISEAAIVGLAAGMAMRGLLPVVEIMFGDFITLIADQVINHIVKFRWMYNEQVTVPLVIRTPMGGRRNYGPTHSQTLEKIFLGIPGLITLAPCPFGDPGKLLTSAVLEINEPVLFIENKLLYPLPIYNPENLREFSINEITYNARLNQFTAPFYSLSLVASPSPVLTIAAYGYMTELVRNAVYRLAYEEEIFAEVIVPTQLAPFTIDPILDSAQKTTKLLVVEEGTKTLGWGAEILARIIESDPHSQITAKRLAASEHPIPASPVLENAALPGVDQIIAAAIQMVRRN